MHPDSRQTDNDSNLAPRVKHPKFFFDNTLIVIEIENVLFNVHKYQLVKSETFADMFAIAEQANTDGKPVEGSSVHNPIKMEGVSAKDFECLLTVLYATYFSSNQPDHEASLIIPAFRLANMWNFSELRAFLLPFAEKVLGDVDKIVFAREFGIDDWLTPAHVNLCQRPQSLTTEEATKLGVHSLLMISRMRERPHQSKNLIEGQYYCSNCVGAHRVGGWSECAGCGNRADPPYLANQSTTGATPNNTTSELLETRVKQWVEAGCVLTE